MYKQNENNVKTKKGIFIICSWIMPLCISMYLIRNEEKSTIKVSSDMRRCHAQGFRVNRIFLDRRGYHLEDNLVLSPFEYMSIMASWYEFAYSYLLNSAVVSMLITSHLLIGIFTGKRRHNIHISFLILFDSYLLISTSVRINTEWKFLGAFLSLMTYRVFFFKDLTIAFIIFVNSC